MGHGGFGVRILALLLVGCVNLGLFRLVFRSIAFGFGAFLEGFMSRLERGFLRVLMVVVLGLVLLGAAWGPTSLARFVLGAGLPQQGEVVPRQIPYRGYVEQNGIGLTSPGIPMRFRLYGADGGVLHEETQNGVVVQDGSFSVELGDSTTIPSGVLIQNFLELEVAVGNPLVVLQGRQRLLSVPFAHRTPDTPRVDAVMRARPRPGFLVPFYGVRSEAELLAQHGWWICDGRLVTDPEAVPALRNMPTPDLRARFLRGTVDFGTVLGGASPATTSDNGEHSHAWPPSWYNRGLAGGPHSGIDIGGNQFWPATVRASGSHSHSVDVDPPHVSVVYLLYVRG